MSELELRLQAQEKDVKNQINKFSEIQSQLEMARKDLAEKDKLLSKSRDELAKATGQYEQSVSKVMLVGFKGYFTTKSRFPHVLLALQSY